MEYIDMWQKIDSGIALFISLGILYFLGKLYVSKDKEYVFEVQQTRETLKELKSYLENVKVDLEIKKQIFSSLDDINVKLDKIIKTTKKDKEI